MNKIEQVAKAIWEHGTGPGYEWENATIAEREHALGYAQTAVDAMREPTDAMLKATQDKIHEIGGESDKMWKAMIDAAVKD